MARPETGGVVNGQAVSQEITNPAFVNANGDDTLQGRYDLSNTVPESGDEIINFQREFNALNSWMGKAINIAKDALPTFLNSQGFTAMQSIFARVDAVSDKFEKTTGGGGHAHDGSDGNGAPIQAASLDGVVLRGYVRQGTIDTYTGTSIDVSANYIGKVPSGGDTLQGVVVIAPNNKVLLRQASGADAGDQFTDGLGNIVYGRLTFSSGVWTLSFFVDLAGVETAYDFTTPEDGIEYYQELFNPITNAPVYSEFAVVPSDNATADVIDATATLRGLMSAGIQTLGGAKTWVGTQLFQAVATFAANIIIQLRIFFVTSTDNTTTGSLATMPAPSTTAVRLTLNTLVSVETISGGSDGRFFIAINKTGVEVLVKDNTGNIRTGTGTDFKWKANATIILYYNGTDSFWHMAGGGGGSDLLLAAVGAVPNANGASYDTGTGVLNLQPADTSFPGVMTAIAQAFSGAKTWTGNMIMQAIIRFDTQTDNATTGSNADLPAPAKGVLRITNASLVSIQRVLTMGNEQVAVLMNKTGVNVTLINNFGADGFLTGNGANLIMLPDTSVLLVKDSISSRVMVVGGGGGSGGGRANVQTLTATGGGPLSVNLVDNPLYPRQIVLIDATLNPVTATMPAAASGTIGTEWVFKRVDAVEANTVTIQRAGADTIDEGNSQTLPYQYNRTSIRGLSATSWGVF